jgi:hypothetical protein
MKIIGTNNKENGIEVTMSVQTVKAYFKKELKIKKNGTDMHVYISEHDYENINMHAGYQSHHELYMKFKCKKKYFGQTANDMASK